MADLSDLQRVFSKIDLSCLNRVPQLRIPELSPIPPNPLITNLDANRASEFYRRLGQWIADFDNSLDDAHEVGLRLVNFGQSVVFHLEDMGYWDPSLISFKGHTDDGNPVELIQHVSQISILLTKLRRKDPSKPKRRIGFAFEHLPAGGLGSAELGAET